MKRKRVIKTKEKNPGENRMKLRGEAKVWKAISSRSGSFKRTIQVQLGQQLIFTDALRILPNVRDWIENKSSHKDRILLQTFFKNDDILLQNITETFLLLASTVYSVKETSGKIHTRHKSVALIQRKLFPNISFDTVWRYLEVVVEASEYFSVERTVSSGMKTVLINLRYICSLPDEISKKLTIDANEAFFPEPMTEKPVDWKCEHDTLSGGYRNYQYDMVRSHDQDIDYSKFPKNIFDALNYIQATPWRVNKDIYEAVKRDLKPPIKSDYVKTVFPSDEGCEWNIKIKESLGLSKERLRIIEDKRAIFSDQISLYNSEARDYESEVGKCRAVELALGVAKNFLQGEIIYFPHSYDSRGRVYPLPVGLSPQGSDAVKAMLEYVGGERLTIRGENWCWSYLASLYGDDKIDFPDRVKRGKELINADYKEADEPYQFLAHQIEMKKYVIDHNYKVKIRIHMDACNSGAQWTSAITGDKKGCLATNVIPTITPEGIEIRQDAYLLVAEKALRLTNEFLGTIAYKLFIMPLRVFKTLLEENGRKICKRPTMISNYGGSARGRAQIIWDLMRELKIDRKWITKKNTALFSKIVGNSIQGVLNGGKAFEGYIQAMSSIIAKKDKPIMWTTPDGFFVVHSKKKELKPKQVSCLLPGARKKTVIYKKIFSDKINPGKMRSAISPNYVHSLDATLLRRVALRMKSAGIKDSDWIHDSFGCRPNYVDKMLNITKDEFRKIIQNKPLIKLDKQLREQAGSTKPILKQLDKIKLPLNKDFDYNLPDLKKSNWFFS